LPEAYPRLTYCATYADIGEFVDLVPFDQVAGRLVRLLCALISLADPMAVFLTRRVPFPTGPSTAIQ